MKRMAEVGWRSRAAKVLPRGMYGHQVDDGDGDGDGDGVVGNDDDDDEEDDTPVEVLIGNRGCGMPPLTSCLRDHCKLSPGSPDGPRSPRCSTNKMLSAV